MEKFIEGTIDKGLESIASGLYFFSFVFGITLVLLGVLLLFNRKDPKKKKTSLTWGLVCLVIGVIAIISGLIQIK